MKLRRYSAFAAGVLTLALLAIPMAEATETTRPEYKEKVEPICKANTIANEKILKGVEAEVRAGKLKPAATQFSKASAALKKTWRQLSAVPQPSADKARLEKWLGYVKTEAELLSKIAQKLRAGNKDGTQRMSIRLDVIGRQANNVVLPFEFEYCLYERSKFT